VKKSRDPDGPEAEEQAKANKKNQIQKMTENKISITTWNPKENTFAVAKGSSLFLFTEKRCSNSSSRSQTSKSQSE
jgi:hypothetical protein